MTSQHTPKPTPFDQLPVTALSDEQASAIQGGVHTEFLLILLGTGPVEFLDPGGTALKARKPSLNTEFEAELATLGGRVDALE